MSTLSEPLGVLSPRPDDAAATPPELPGVDRPGSGIAGEAPQDTFVWACPCCHAALRTVASARRGSCPACGVLIEAPQAPSTAAPELTADSPADAGDTKSTHGLHRLVGLCSCLPHRGRQILTVSLLATLSLGGSCWLAQSVPWSRLFRPQSTTLARKPASPDFLRAKLHRFLQAPDWTTKRAFVLDASRLRRAGTDYYQGRDPDIVNARDFQPWEMPGLDRKAGVMVLRADRPGRRPVLALFREAEGDWYLDWEMFCQTYDEAFPAFLAQPSYSLRVFRGRLTRVFDDTAPENTYTVQLRDPLESGQSITLQLPLGTPIMHSVAGGLTSPASRDATVEVCWARPDPAGDWVPVLHRLVCWGWDGLNGLPEVHTPASPAHPPFSLPTQAPHDVPPPTPEDSLATASTASTNP
ncbi:MAG: hypothetical protein ACKV19_28485 [Verrucomicrobiales bacterium]